MSEPIRHLGRYELLRRIAVGGMGEIFLARMRGAAGFEKRVIIKTILGHLAAEEEFVTKFLDEGRTVVQLTHGNIVPVFDMGEEDGEYFIAMEYIPGRDLREILRRLMPQGRGLPVELATYVVSELCKGLDYAHRKEDEQGQLLGIVHRDVSPSNVLISHEGEVKVIDFGIASATSRLAQTVSGRIQGKFCYMSPEQATGARVDERSDIFAAGVVLYELLTNARPFHGANDMETLDLVRRCEVDPPSVLDPTIPPEVDAIVMRALQRDREARYPSIDRMQVDLLEYLYTHGQSPTGRDLARFVTGLFEEGFERAELKTPSRSGSSGANKRASLDELLEQELGRLGAATPSQPGSIDPWTATAAPKRPSEPRTATLAAPQPPTPSQGLILSQDTRAPEDRTSQDTPSQTPPGAQDTPQPSAPELTPASGVAALTITQVRGIKRAAVAMVVLIGLGVAGGSIASHVMAERRVGFVVVRSEPAGATIYVDDARVPDALTPHTLELSAGARRIALRKEGFEPSDAFGVKVKAGQTMSLSDAPVTLRAQAAAAPAPQARRFTIRTSPSEVELSVNGERVGLTPRIIKVRDGEPANLAFSREGCEPANYVLVASQRHDEVKVSLSCEAAPGLGATTAPQPEQPQPARPQAKREVREREVRVTANVAGAQVKIDGQALGAAPAKAMVSGRGRVRVEVTHPDHEPYSRTLSVAEIPASGLSVTLAPLPMGCLDFSILRPRHNALFIDGAPLGRHSYLKGHPVAVGTHTLRIVNEVARFDRSVSFKVKAGPSCALVSLGEEAAPDEPKREPDAP